MKESEPESSPRVRVDANATEPKINNPNQDQEKVSALLYNFAGYTTDYVSRFSLHSGIVLSYHEVHILGHIYPCRNGSARPAFNALME